jgi:hypothetical protein
VIPTARFEATANGFELEFDCALLEEAFATCDATVEDILACEQAGGDFAASRVCTTESLEEIEPDCAATLAEVCPDLYLAE